MGAHINASPMSLTTLNPSLYRIQRRIVIKPMTCPQIGGSEISDNVLVRNAGQFLL
jgi:hypothetical protein